MQGEDMHMDGHRTNRQLRKDFEEQIRHADEYKISIMILHIEDQFELTVFLDVDGEKSSDYGCIMTEDGCDPSRQMKGRAKMAYNYFRQHFSNVMLNEEVVYV